MAISKRRYYTFCGLVGLFIIIFDQATKFAILAFVPISTSIEVCPNINLTLTFNSGTSFGFLSPSNEIQYYLIIILTVCCIAFICYMLTTMKNLMEKLLCSMLISGAMGNLIDRFIHGAVIDFVDIYYKNWHFPAFNFADACISCSVIILIIYSLCEQTKR